MGYFSNLLIGQEEDDRATGRDLDEAVLAEDLRLSELALGLLPSPPVLPRLSSSAAWNDDDYEPTF